MLKRPRTSAARLGFGLLGLLLVLALPLAWYLGSPLFLDRAVEEGPFDAAAARASPVRSGRFVGADSFHMGAGRATIFRLPDGRQTLRLEEFTVTNGPDLYVYLSGHPAPRDSAQLHGSGDFEVARLRGNIGEQSYDLPADLDVGAFKSVVIYCKRFTTVFSTAELAPAAATAAGAFAPPAAAAYNTVPGGVRARREEQL